MKNILLLSALALLLFSCKKKDNDGVTPINADYFTFGLSGGLCGMCYHYYQVRDGHIYEDSMHTPSGWIYKTQPMSQSKFNTAVPLMSSFPGYLSAHKDTTFGCNGCADQQVFFIEILQDGIKTHWYIDDVDQAQPVEIKPYMTQMRNVIQALAN